jgi:hypothetical protein
MSVSNQGNEMRHLVVIAGPDGRDYTTQKLSVPIELLVRFVELLNVSLVSDLPPLVTASVVGAFAGSCTASTTRLPSCTLISLLMMIHVRRKMDRTFVFRSLHAEQAVEILRGFCTRVVPEGPTPLPDGLGANCGWDVGFDISQTAWKRGGVTITQVLSLVLQSERG